MLIKNTFVVEVTGITGAGYPPALLKAVAAKLRGGYFALHQGRPRPLWNRYYVDNTWLQDKAADKWRLANSLILKGGTNLTDDEVEALVGVSREADGLILDDLKGFRYPVNVVLRRGGVLQSYIHIGDRRWQRMRLDRALEPKLLLFVVAESSVIKESYKLDEEFRRLRTEHPEYYCATPARAEEQQQEWLRAVAGLPGVRIIKRVAYDVEVLATELSDVIVAEGPMVELRTLKKASCFVSFSHKDQEFCDRLYRDLIANGVESSYFPEKPYEAGEPLWDQIERSLEASAVVVLVASEDSLAKSRAVMRELQLAFGIEDRRKRRILKVAALDDYVFASWRHEYAERVRHDVIADFSGWKNDQNTYRRGFDKLLAGLRR